MSEPEGGKENDEALRARLDALSSALRAQQDVSRKRDASREAENSGDGSLGRAMSLGFRVLSEFVAAIVVSSLIGWQIDEWTKTTPLFLIVFLTMGTAAGFWTVYRIAAQPTGSDRDGDQRN